MKISVNSPCPCGSQKKFKKCCKVFHNLSIAKNALELMKSRYSAFVVENSKYIMKTTHKENKDFSDDLSTWESTILTFARHCTFKRLEILDFIDGEEESYVTFKATIFQADEDISFTEKSKFLKVDEKWLYHSGKFIDE